MKFLKRNKNSDIEESKEMKNETQKEKMENPKSKSFKLPLNKPKVSNAKLKSVHSTQEVEDHSCKQITIAKSKKSLRKLKLEKANVGAQKSTKPVKYSETNSSNDKVKNSVGSDMEIEKSNRKLKIKWKQGKSDSGVADMQMVTTVDQSVSPQGRELGSPGASADSVKLQQQELINNSDKDKVIKKTKQTRKTNCCDTHKKDINELECESVNNNKTMAINITTSHPTQQKKRSKKLNTLTCKPNKSNTSENDCLESAVFKQLSTKEGKPKDQKKLKIAVTKKNKLIKKDEGISPESGLNEKYGVSKPTASKTNKYHGPDPNTEQEDSVPSVNKSKSVNLRKSTVSSVQCSDDSDKKLLSKKLSSKKKLKTKFDGSCSSDVVTNSKTVPDTVKQIKKKKNAGYDNKDLSCERTSFEDLRGEEVKQPNCKKMKRSTNAEKAKLKCSNVHEDFHSKENIHMHIDQTINDVVRKFTDEQTYFASKEEIYLHIDQTIKDVIRKYSYTPDQDHLKKDVTTKNICNKELKVWLQDVTLNEDLQKRYNFIRPYKEHNSNTKRQKRKDISDMSTSSNFDSSINRCKGEGTSSNASRRVSNSSSCSDYSVAAISRTSLGTSSKSVLQPTKWRSNNKNPQEKSCATVNYNKYSQETTCTAMKPNSSKSSDHSSFNINKIGNIRITYNRETKDSIVRNVPVKKTICNDVPAQLNTIPVISDLHDISAEDTTFEDENRLSETGDSNFEWNLHDWKCNAEFESCSRSWKEVYFFDENTIIRVLSYDNIFKGSVLSVKGNSVTELNRCDSSNENDEYSSSSEIDTTPTGVSTILKNRDNRVSDQENSPNAKQKWNSVPLTIVSPTRTAYSDCMNKNTASQVRDQENSSNTKPKFVSVPPITFTRTAPSDCIIQNTASHVTDHVKYSNTKPKLDSVPPTTCTRTIASDYMTQNSTSQISDQENSQKKRKLDSLKELHSKRFRGMTEFSSESDSSLNEEITQQLSSASENQAIRDAPPEVGMVTTAERSNISPVGISTTRICRVIPDSILIPSSFNQTSSERETQFRVPSLPPAKRPPTRIVSKVALPRRPILALPPRVTHSFASGSQSSVTSEISHLPTERPPVTTKISDQNDSSYSEAADDDTISLYAGSLCSMDLKPPERQPSTIDLQNKSYISREIYTLNEQSQDTSTCSEVEQPNVSPISLEAQNFQDSRSGSISQWVTTTSKYINKRPKFDMYSEVPTIFKGLCVFYWFRERECSYSRFKCKRSHIINRNVIAQINNLSADQLRESYTFAKDKSFLLKHIFDHFVSAFERLKCIPDILAMVSDVLKIEDFNKTPLISKVICTLQGLGLSFIEAIHDIIEVLGSNNISDILLDIVCIERQKDLCNNWCLVQKLTKYRKEPVDHGLVEEIMLECCKGNSDQLNDKQLTKYLIRDIIRPDMVNINAIRIGILNDFLSMLKLYNFTEEENILSQKMKAYNLLIIPTYKSVDGDNRHRNLYSEFSVPNSRSDSHITFPTHSASEVYKKSDLAVNTEGQTTPEFSYNTRLDYRGVSPAVASNRSGDSRRSLTGSVGHKESDFASTAMGRNILQDNCDDDHDFPNVVYEPPSPVPSCTRSRDSIRSLVRDVVHTEFNLEETTAEHNVLDTEIDFNNEAEIRNIDYPNVDPNPENKVSSDSVKTSPECDTFNNAVDAENVQQKSNNSNNTPKYGYNDYSEFDAVPATFIVPTQTSLQFSQTNENTGNEHEFNFDEEVTSSVCSTLSTSVDVLDGTDMHLSVTDMTNLRQIISQGKILEFFSMLDKFKDTTFSRSLILNTIVLFKIRNPDDIYRIFINVIKGLELLAPNFMDTSGMTPMLQMLAINTIGLLARRKAYKEAADILHKFGNRLQDLKETTWFPSVHTNTYSDIGKYLYFAKIFTRGGLLKEAWDILTSDKKLLYGKHCWELPFNEDFDVRYRNHIVQILITDAVDTDIRFAKNVILCLIIGDKDQVNEIDIWKYYNLLLMRMLDNSDLYLDDLKGMMINIMQGWYKNLFKPIMRALLVVLITDISEDEAIQFYYKCCTQNIYQNINGDEKTIEIKTDMAVEEIYMTLRVFFHKIIKNSFPTHDLILKIRLPEVASLQPKILVNSNVSVQELKYRICHVLAKGFDFIINVKNNHSDPYIIIEADQMLPCIDYYRNIQRTTR